MVEPKIVVHGADAVLYDSRLPDSVRADWFEPEHWQGSGAVELETSGRGSVLIVTHGAERWVLRHYHRGGFVARFIEDHYFWFGLERTRAFREWRLLRSMHDDALPVPNPIAARVRRAGPVYTADILTTYLPETRKFSAFL